MKTACAKPPECCVIIEMEPGTSIGYRRAVLLNEIDALESITKAAMTSRIPLYHARELVLRMNREFSAPLVNFADNGSGLRKVEDFVSRLEVLSYENTAASHYGGIRENLEKKGIVIGVIDLRIAAHARSEGFILVSNNVREFERVEGLRLENWIESK